MKNEPSATNKTQSARLRIAILGGGPSGLFMYKRLTEMGRQDVAITIFEATDRLGEGFPYSLEGANPEHITNVSGNEIPDIVQPVSEWIKTVPQQQLKQFGIDVNHFNDYKVLPRLLFGKYLAAQFDLIQKQAKEKGIESSIIFNSKATDVSDDKENKAVTVEINGSDKYYFDRVIICTGHHWPVSQEGKVPGYFDSPYPPKKLMKPFNHPVAIRGASLTAIDAIRTLARQHGKFKQSDTSKKIVYTLSDAASNFKIVMHSRSGMLPAVRFHLEDPHLSKDKLLTKEQIAAHMKSNDGFLSIDFIFANDFKEPLRQKDPILYEQIKDMTIEEFVTAMLRLREQIDAFDLFKGEYAEAAQSIRRKESVHWKEALAILSFAMNYPAKHFSAEDMLRLQHTLMPLIALVIAFVPQSSVEELIALHEAGLLSLLDVGPESKVVADTHNGGIVYHHTDETGREVQTAYETYVDCVGQSHLPLHAFPFKSLIDTGTVSPARLKFRSSLNANALIAEGKEGISSSNGNDYYFQVSGLAINDYFQAVDSYGAFSENIYIMAVPFIGGFNPDYSGLDFCEAASTIIAERISCNI